MTARRRTSVKKPRPRYFSVRLLIVHPSIDPKVITKGIGLVPDLAHMAGSPFYPPYGKRQCGYWNDTRWAYDPAPVDRPDFFQAGVIPLLNKVEPKAGFIHELVEGGGSADAYLSLFGDSDYGDRLGWSELFRLATAGVDLGVEVFRCQPSPPEEIDTVSVPDRERSDEEWEDRKYRWEHGKKHTCVAWLAVDHPRLDAGEIGCRLGLAATPTRGAGVPSDDGGPAVPERLRDATWACRFVVERQKRFLSGGIVPLIDRLQARGDALRALRAGGGAVTLHLQLPGMVNLSDSLDCPAALRLAAMQVDLAIDVHADADWRSLTAAATSDPPPARDSR